MALWSTTLVLLLALVSPATASEPVVEIVLVDGSVLRGRVLLQDLTHLVVSTESLGRIEIALEEVRSVGGRDPRVDPVVVEDRRAGQRRDPDLNSIVLSPTTETLPKGDLYFRSFELFFLNFGGGITDDLDYSIGTLFPVSSEVWMLGLGLKYRLFSRETSPVGLAVTGGGVIFDETWFSTVSVVAGIGDAHRSLNVSVHQGFSEDETGETALVVGGDFQVSRTTKLLAEYGTGFANLFDDDDLDGYLNVGVRFFGDESSFSLTGLRPLGIGNTDGLIAVPLVMYSRHF